MTVDKYKNDEFPLLNCNTFETSRQKCFFFLFCFRQGILPYLNRVNKLLSRQEDLQTNLLGLLLEYFDKIIMNVSA